MGGGSPMFLSQNIVQNAFKYSFQFLLKKAGGKGWKCHSFKSILDFSSSGKLRNKTVVLYSQNYALLPQSSIAGK